VNKCSEVKYGVFRVEVKVWKEQIAECTGVSARAAGLLNGSAGFEPTTLDSREKAMYNQCGRGFTTIPLQPPCGLPVRQCTRLSMSLNVILKAIYAQYDAPNMPTHIK